MQMMTQMAMALSPVLFESSLHWLLHRSRTSWCLCRRVLVLCCSGTEGRRRRRRSLEASHDGCGGRRLTSTAWC
uniref:Uncharacterized protein n=1 Tax=Arundo donax TaxID=35708 RepID=A0A0A9F783_ARUDO